MARTPTLQAIVDEDENRAGALLTHPMQRQARHRVFELLEALAEVQSAGDLFEFQRSLLGASLFVAEVASQLRRGEARAVRGKATEAPAGWEPAKELRSADEWLFELTVADRLIRQFRCVGDALAWKAFKYDRRVILALSANPAPGPLAGKTGLDAEWAAVNAARSRGEFALMHDLTSVLRIADLTVFTAERPELIEVKSSAGGATSGQAGRQRRRAILAIASLDGGRLPGPKDDQRHLYASDVQLRTHFPGLARLCEAARRDGWSVGSMRHGLVVSVVDMWSAMHAGDPVELLAAHDTAITRARVRRGRPGKHEIKARLVDLAARDPGFAPMSIYPLPADVRAGLICDDILVSIEQLLDPLQTLLERQNLQVRGLLPDAPGDLDAPTFQLWETGGRRTLTVHGRSLAQKLVEFVDSTAWAQAAAALVREDQPPEQPVVVYANERAVWGRST